MPDRRVPLLRVGPLRTGLRRPAVRAAGAVVVAGALLVGVAAGALAHPSGEFGPPTARLSAEGRTVTIELSAPPDDAAAIGTAVGLLPEDAMEAFLLEDEEAQPTAAQVRELSASPELRAYLLDHVQVRQDGRACAGTARPAADLLADGAELTFTCEDPVALVDVRITVLHDQDPRYATFGLDGARWTVLFTAAQPEHAWDARSSASGPGPFAVLAIVAGLLLVLGALAGLLIGRRRSSSHTVPGPGVVGGIPHRETEGQLRTR